jgi:hypothetical protein
MFHSTISETRRRTLLVLLFVCALILSAVLYGAREADGHGDLNNLAGNHMHFRTPGVRERSQSADYTNVRTTKIQTICAHG